MAAYRPGGQTKIPDASGSPTWSFRGTCRSPSPSACRSPKPLRRTDPFACCGDSAARRRSWRRSRPRAARRCARPSASCAIPNACCGKRWRSTMKSAARKPLRGGPGGTRTHYPLLRRQLLCPDELQTLQKLKLINLFIYFK